MCVETCWGSGSFAANSFHTAADKFGVAINFTRTKLMVVGCQFRLNDAAQSVLLPAAEPPSVSWHVGTWQSDVPGSRVACASLMFPSPK